MKEKLEIPLWENIGVATLLGLAALIFSMLSNAFLTIEQRKEKEIIASITEMSVAKEIPIKNNPTFNRLFRLIDKGKERYATIARFSSYQGSVAVVLVFASNGELIIARIVGDNSSVFPYSRDKFLSSFLGKGSKKAFPMNSDQVQQIDAASGATETFIATSMKLKFLSDLVISISQSDK